MNYGKFLAICLQHQINEMPDRFLFTWTRSDMGWHSTRTVKGGFRTAEGFSLGGEMKTLYFCSVNEVPSAPS